MAFRDNDHAALARAQALQQELEEKERKLQEAQERIERLEHAAEASPAPEASPESEASPEPGADPSPVSEPPQPSPTPEPAEPFLNPFLVGFALLGGPFLAWLLLPGYAIDLRPEIGILCGFAAALVTQGWRRRRGDGFGEALVVSALAMLVVGNAALLLVHGANRLLDDSPSVNEVGRAVVSRSPPRYSGRMQVRREGHADSQSIWTSGNFDVGDPVYFVVRHGFFGLEWSPHYARDSPPRSSRK